MKFLVHSPRVLRSSQPSGTVAESPRPWTWVDTATPPGGKGYLRREGDTSTFTVPSHWSNTVLLTSQVSGTSALSWFLFVIHLSNKIKDYYYYTDLTEEFYIYKKFYRQGVTS